MLRLLPTLGPMADARLLPLVMQGLQPVPEAAPTPGASKCSSPLIHVLVLEEKKRMVWDYTCSTEDTTVSYHRGMQPSARDLALERAGPLLGQQEETEGLSLCLLSV